TALLLAAALGALMAATPVHAAAGDAGSAEAVSLEEIIARARAASPAVQEALRSLELAESALRQEDASYRPRLSLDGSWDRAVALERDKDGRTSSVLSVTASQVLATGSALGKVQMERQLAALDVEEALLVLR